MFRWKDSTAEGGWLRDLTLAGGIVDVWSLGYVVSTTREFVAITSSVIWSEGELNAILNCTSVPWVAIEELVELPELAREQVIED